MKLKGGPPEPAAADPSVETGAARKDSFDCSWRLQIKVAAIRQFPKSGYNWSVRLQHRRVSDTRRLISTSAWCIVPGNAPRLGKIRRRDPQSRAPASALTRK